MKKAVSILLALVIAFSFAVAASAAEINSETVELVLNAAKEIIEMLIFVFKENIMPLITDFIALL